MAENEIEEENKTTDSEENESVVESKEENEDSQVTESSDGSDEKGKINQEVLQGIPVTISVEVGKTSLKIRDLLRLSQGSVVELDRLAGDALDILANGTKIAKGEVVMVGEKFGIRFTEVATPEELIENL